MKYIFLLSVLALFLNQFAEQEPLKSTEKSYVSMPKRKMRFELGSTVNVDDKGLLNAVHADTVQIESYR